MHARTHAPTHMCMCVCVCVCARARTHTHTLANKNQKEAHLRFSLTHRKCRRYIHHIVHADWVFLRPNICIIFYFNCINVLL